jgi:acetyl-CoA acetyltransferase
MGQGGAIITAMLAVASGLCRHVLCYRTVFQSSSGLMGLGGGGGRASGPQEWRAPYGLYSAANSVGMAATQYMHRYGADRSMLGHVAVNARANAGRNPIAIYRDPMSMDDYMNARLVSTPFGLYDCDVPCDAAIAVIVSAAETAADLKSPAIRVEAVGTQIVERQSWDQDTITHMQQTFGPAAHVWRRTDLRHDDIDVALIYDGFTFNAITWIEALGFCGFGEAQDWLDGGRRIALDGPLPVNPHGGQLSEGRTHGFGFWYEAVTQLRGRATGRQVEGARTAVVTNGGVAPGGAVILRRD